MSPVKNGELMPSSENVLKVYRSATPEQMLAGLTWYADAHTFALSLDTDINRSAGIIAALSPQQSWERNMLLAARVYAEEQASGTLGDACRKAERIFHGESWTDVLKGKKVLSFCSNILDPTGHAVTIDRHAHDIAVMHRLGSDPRRVLERKGGYELFESVYQEASETLGVPAPAVQAVAWCAWRELIGVVNGTATNKTIGPVEISG